jgi:hypothetical protein
VFKTAVSNVSLTIIVGFQLVLLGKYMNIPLDCFEHRLILIATLECQQYDHEESTNSTGECR